MSDVEEPRTQGNSDGPGRPAGATTLAQTRRKSDWRLVYERGAGLPPDGHIVGRTESVHSRSPAFSGSERSRGHHWPWHVSDVKSGWNRTS